MGWKYVILKSKSPDGMEYAFPIIFPDKLTHSEVARALRRHCPGSDLAELKSAGFVSLKVNSTFGHSESLSVDSQTDDKDIINNYDYQHGIL